MGGLFLILFFLLLVMGAAAFIVLAGESGEESTEAPPSPSPEDLEDPDELIDLAEKHESNHDWIQARQAWSQLIDRQPERSDAYFRRGICFYRTDDYDQAARDFQAVLEHADDPPPALHLYLARSYNNLERPNEAFEHYEKYVESGDPDLAVLNTAADLARQLEKWSRASTYYETIRTEGDETQRVDALLALADMAFERKMSDRATSRLEKLQKHFEDGHLTDNQELAFRYLWARHLEHQEKFEEADRIIRTIYHADPGFRDVADRVEEQISELAPDKLPRKFQRMDRESLVDFSRRILEGMGYELIEAQHENPEEFDLLARERAMGLRVNRALFSVKRWQETVGEIPLKEFEYKLVEDRHDEGYFISPAGFKPAAEHYARGSAKLNLIGPDDILSHFKDWYLSDVEANG